VADPPSAIESPFDAGLIAGRSGAGDGEPGVAVTKRPGLAVLSLVARKNSDAALAAHCADRHAIALPAGPRYVPGNSLAAVGIGPGRWLLVGETADPDALCRQVAADTKDLAAVADLSDALPVLRLSGRAARAVLAKGLPIDLHPRSFGPGDAASSIAALIPLHLWQLDDGPTYEIAVPRSMAASFAKWLTDSAAEFGLLVEP
jgi:sarcosine oxidase subunit gamma